MRDWNVMVDSTFDEIRRCPKCQELGSPDGTQGYMYYFVCQNPKCRWFQSAPWVRQRNPDGTWVQEQKHKKFFPNVPDRTAEVQAQIDREIARSMGQDV